MKKFFGCILCYVLVFSLCAPFVCRAEDNSIVLAYSDIFNCVVNSLQTAKWERQTENGNKYLRVVPDTESELYTEISASKPISLDSWGLDKYKIDFTKYRYVTIEYKYTSKHPADTVPVLNILKQKVLSSSVKISADDTIISGKNAKMTFYIPNISGLILTPDTPYISQLHLYPFGEMYVNALDAEDEIIIGNIIKLLDYVLHMDLIMTR